MLSLYLDEDSQDHRLIAGLRRLGFNCLTANEVGGRGRSDEEHLLRAAREGRCLYTKNAGDFRRLHEHWLRVGRPHSGIIALTYQRLGIGKQLAGLEAIARELDEQQMTDNLVYLLNYLR